MKITDYPINNDPNPETEYVVCAYSGQNYKILAGNLNFFSPRNKMIPRIAELSEAGNSIFQISSGPISTENNHPMYLSGVTTISYNSTLTSVLGGETIEMIFRISSFYLKNIGLHGGSVSINMRITALGVLNGQTVNTLFGGGTSNTITSYTLSLNTWYRMKISINAAVSLVDYYIYNESGVLLWTDSLSTDIPTQLSLVQIVPAGNFFDVDWIALYNNTELVR